MTPQPTRIAYARTLGRALAGFSLLAGAAAPALEPDPRNAVWINCAVILCYVGLERLAARYWPGRVVSLLRATLFIAAVSPVFLVTAIFLQGDAPYANMAGRFTHSDGAWLVALAGLVLHAFALVGAALAGRRPTTVPAGAAELRLAFSRWFLLLVAWLVGLHAVLRVTLLFYLSEIPQPIVYLSRLYLSHYLALFVCLGISLRLRLRSAQVATAISLLVSAVVLLSGGRSDALYPLLFLGAGFVLARPVERKALARWATVAVPVFLLAMYAGGLVREDDRGRTGDAVIERVGDLASAMTAGDGGSSAVDMTVRRLVSNSTHSVITRIPSEFPFESDGVLQLPVEFLARVLPRFNLSGISETEQPRNWMLNDLGFLVSWATSVELGLVADAWYRGGFWGLVAVGLILGVSLQLLENGVYRAMRRASQYSAVLLFIVPWLLPIQGRDIVEGLRTILFASIAGLAMVAAARALETRKQGRARPLAPAAPLAPGQA